MSFLSVGVDYVAGQLLLDGEELLDVGSVSV